MGWRRATRWRCPGCNQKRCTCENPRGQVLIAADPELAKPVRVPDRGARSWADRQRDARGAR